MSVGWGWGGGGGGALFVCACVCVFEAMTNVEAHDAATEAHHPHKETEHLIRGVGLGYGLASG